MENIRITRTGNSRIGEVDWKNPGFGKYFSDHMFVLDFRDGSWVDPRIEPYGSMEFEPGLCTLHYGQTIFEGMKAFRATAGGINLFRPDSNMRRLNQSADLLCIPRMDEDFLLSALKDLIRVDRDWVPRERGHSLYIRPVVFGTDNFLGVRASLTYSLIIMTSPVAAYYPEGINPVRILVDQKHVRAVRGGLGSAKTAANYAASLYAGTEAKNKGFAQVLFLDGVSHTFVDEVGTMNMMFLIGDELITPPLDQGSILAGVTRDSVLQIARSWDMNVSERALSIEEVLQAHETGNLKEAFGTGTAAVISPVGELVYGDTTITIYDNKIGPLAQKLYDAITALQYGESQDAFGWVQPVEIEEDIPVRNSVEV